MPSFTVSPTPPLQHRLLTSAIERREVLRFIYEGVACVVEPHTFGMDWEAQDVLRAFEVSAGRETYGAGPMRLFLVSDLSVLRKTGQTFAGPRPGHNPNDSSMRTIYATLE